MTIYDIIPDAKALLSLEPEEVAGVIIEYLNKLPDDSKSALNKQNFGLPHTVAEYPQELQASISQVLMEGWSWLEREGLIASRPGDNGGWIFVTRRGKQINNKDELKAFRNTNLLPKFLLHPQIARKIWSSFIRGEYDTAVFQAFKEVEVAVREKTGMADNIVGVDLMRKAFSPTDGKLTNHNYNRGESQALVDLFAGAIGSYKNPHSHRNIPMNDPIEATEMLILASHLLKIVEKAEVHENSNLSV